MCNNNHFEQVNYGKRSLNSNGMIEESYYRKSNLVKLGYNE